jgi:phage tail sheath protein FI
MNVSRRKLFGFGLALVAAPTAVLAAPKIYGDYSNNPLYADIQRAMVKVLEPCYFEPNDEITRSYVSNVLTAYMGRLKEERQIVDYLVRCNEMNNSPKRVDNNEMYVDVLIKPVKSINYIQLDAWIHR